MDAQALSAYLARIGYAGAVEPTLGVLRELVAHHLAAIPFESLDPLLGLPVNLEPAALQNKLVHTRRGGYCHEHNALFHDVLSALGYAVTPLGGRVVWAFKGQPAPLTHRLTLVDLPEGRFIADVGFGGQSPPAPLHLAPGVVQPTPHGTYRIGSEGEAFSLELRLTDRWETTYLFTLAPQNRIDFEVANWFTSTHPSSLFTQNLVASRIVGDTRCNLRNRDLSIRRQDGHVEERRLENACQLQQVLEEVMGLEPPAPAEAIWAKVALNADRR